MNDEFFMGLALQASRKALPVCLPNPPVGCVIVRDGQVLSEGFTHEPGRFHAEAHALSKVPSDLEGATAYVTLEPCSFRGRTPSCALALLERGIRRVVVSLVDPDPRNNGKGIAMLREGGVDVITGILEDRVSEFIRPHLNLPENTGVASDCCAGSGKELMRFQLGVTMGEGCVALEDVLFCVQHGVTEFRVNLASPWAREHAPGIASVLRQARADMDGLSILWDLPFPNKKSRYYTFQGQRYDIARGDRLRVIPAGQAHQRADEISVPESLFKRIEAGDRLVVGDGETMLVAQCLSSKGVECSVTHDWFISDGKSLTIEGRENLVPSTLEDLPLALAEFDGLTPQFACSFIRNREDLSLCRKYFPPHSRLMAKVETAEGVENAKEIAHHADSVMVARGDLALNMGFVRLGRAQRALIDACNAARKSVFVATELLSSLSFRSTPLRAEASDLFHLCASIRQGGLFLTKESSMPGMLRRSLPLIAEIAQDARRDIASIKTLDTPQDALATAR